jgi:hypothetical protein
MTSPSGDCIFYLPDRPSLLLLPRLLFSSTKYSEIFKAERQESTINNGIMLFKSGEVRVFPVKLSS